VCARSAYPNGFSGAREARPYDRLNRYDVPAQVVGFTVQRFRGWMRKRSIFMLFQLLNLEPLNRERDCPKRAIGFTRHLRIA